MPITTTTSTKAATTTTSTTIPATTTSTTIPATTTSTTIPATTTSTTMPITTTSTTMPITTTTSTKAATTTTSTTIPAITTTTIPATELEIKTLGAQNIVLSQLETTTSTISNNSTSTTTSTIPNNATSTTKASKFTDIPINNPMDNNYNNYNNQKSHFDNVNSIILNSNDTPGINNYVNSYNRAISLMDDPNQLNNAALDTYIHIQNQKLEQLQSNLLGLQSNIALQQNNNYAPVKSMKSMYNSRMLNVEEFPSPSNGNAGSDQSKYPNYLIYGNRGCLQYNSPNPMSTIANGVPSPPNWSFQNCNSNLPSQQFYKKQINNLADYNTPITSDNTKKILNTNSTMLGFYVVNPSTDPNQCLQLNNDGLSVMPCTMDSSQRFKPSYHSVLQ